MNRHLRVNLALAAVIASAAVTGPAADEPAQPVPVATGTSRRVDPQSSPGPRARAVSANGAALATSRAAGTLHPDIGAVGEILRQRLAEAADAGIVIFRDGNPEVAPAVTDPGSDRGPGEPHPSGAARSSGASAAVEPAAMHRGAAAIIAPPLSPGLPDLPPHFDQSADLVDEVGVGFPDGPRRQPPSVLDPAAAGDAIVATGPRPAERASTPGHRATDQPATAGCLSDERLALPLVPASAGLAALQARRTALLGEFDRPDPAAVEGVARLYLAAGLGSEAAALVRDFVEDGALAEHLGHLAVLVEGDARPLPGAFVARGCKGLHSVWRAYALALAGEAGAAMAEIGPDIAAIEGLPFALRSRIAIELALSALDAGDADRAAWLRAMASRGDQSDPAAGWRLRLVEARLDLAEGRTRMGITGLSDLVVAGGEAGERAAFALAGLGPGRALAETHVLEVAADLLGAWALIDRGTDAGASALRAEALIVAHLSGQGQAVSLLSHALARGLVDADAYVAGIAALDRPAGTDIVGRPLALLHDEAPAQFHDALAHAEFRRALALSYAGIGAPLLARRVIEPEDLADDAFRQAFVQTSAPFADGELAAWLGGASPAAPVTMPASAPPGEPGLVAAAEPRLREGAESQDTAAVPPSADLARQALGAIASAANDIERIRRILDDG